MYNDDDLGDTTMENPHSAAKFLYVMSVKMLKKILEKILRALGLRSDNIICSHVSPFL